MHDVKTDGRMTMKWYKVRFTLEFQKNVSTTTSISYVNCEEEAIPPPPLNATYSYRPRTSCVSTHQTMLSHFYQIGGIVKLLLTCSCCCLLCCSAASSFVAVATAQKVVQVVFQGKCSRRARAYSSPSFQQTSLLDVL